MLRIAATAGRPLYHRLPIKPSTGGKLASCRRFCATIKSEVEDINTVNASLPTKKTTVILRKIPPTVTQTILREAIKDIEKCRKVELEPGCVLHFSNEVAAERSLEAVTKHFKCDASISKTQLPALLLHNLPPGISADSLKATFNQFHPTGITTAGFSYQVFGITRADAALKAAHILDQLQFHGQTLKTNLVKMGTSYCVSVFNFPDNLPSGAESIEASLRAALGDEFKDVSINKHNSARSAIKLRFENKAAAESAKKTLSKFTLNGENVELSDKVTLLRPALFLRNTKDIPRESLIKLMATYNAERVVFNYARAGVSADLAVVYFASEVQAQSALKFVKGLSVDGHVLNVSYKEVEEPGVLVSNLPEGIDVDGVKEAFSVLSIGHVELLSGNKAVVTFTHPHDLELAVNAYNKKLVRGQTINVTKKAITDYGFEVSLPSGKALTAPDVIALQGALSAASVSTKAATLVSNSNAFVSFLTVKDAISARDGLVKGLVTVASSDGQGLVTSHLSSQPSFTLEVVGLSPETPAKEVADLVEQAGHQQYLLQMDRSATVKFRRHMHVVPGIKALKKLRIDGSNQALEIERYYPQPEKGGDTTYDVAGLEEEFDRVTLRSLVADHMQSDPATRYQIAKNMFERALVDAKAHEDLSYLITGAVTPDAKAEAEQLLKQPFLNDEQTHQLFDLYLQRDDMLTFASDFKDMMAFFGDIEEDNPFNWSQFDVSTVDDWDRYASFRRAMKQRDLDLNKTAKFAAGRGQTISDYLDDLVDEDTSRFNNYEHTFDTKFMKNLPKHKYPESGTSSPSSADLLAEEAQKKAAEEETQRRYRSIAMEKLRKGETLSTDLIRSIEDSAALLDAEGENWSGVILDTDIVQHTLPRNRENSERCLVMIGNMRGVGGFGMGKGKDPADAADKAFRAALRNLIFIDLYDNSSLAHDLYGRWNGCHCYIRATSRSRHMVAAPWVDEVLGRLGIASASVKLIGRRDPYSAIRALFDALSHHQNIDETAKERGQRYLTLKWAHDHGLGM